MRRFIVLAATLTMLAAPVFAADGDDTDAAQAPAAAATTDNADTDADRGPLDDAGFDAQFQCPETFRDADARIEEFQRYVEWTRETHPDWGFRKRLDVRYGLLRRHNCATTLAKIASSAQPAFH
ncbi:MAG TPA: hypothetical protein VG387_19420 [Rhizomicrobium sp.]|jgi:hypothetical protein|nr:hypothetical protein [Rhizomicrobium sp.]